MLARQRPMSTAPSAAKYKGRFHSQRALAR
jgi:hypothetical protein